MKLVTLDHLKTFLACLSKNFVSPFALADEDGSNIKNTYLKKADAEKSYASMYGANASGSWPIDVTGNAATATKLQTPRRIALTGSVAGGIEFDGSSDISIDATIDAEHAGLATKAWADSFQKRVDELKENVNNIEKTSVFKISIGDEVQVMSTTNEVVLNEVTDDDLIEMLTHESD